MFLVRNDSGYKDRTFEAFKHGLKSHLGKNLTFISRGVLESGYKFPAHSNEDRLIVYGNLRDYTQPKSRQQRIANSILLLWLEKFLGRKFWMISQDLDHATHDLIFGIKTNVENLTSDRTVSDHINMFDGLIWFGEDLLLSIPNLDYAPNSSLHWQPEYIEKRRNLLKSTIIELKSIFSWRIEYTHCVPDKVLGLARLALRSRKLFDLAFIGTMYNNRIYAHEALSHSGVKFAPFERYEKLLTNVLKISEKGFYLVGNNVPPHTIKRSLRYASQQMLYAQSSYAWADPGYFGYLVRKYFEATLSGSAILGMTNFHIEHKGFMVGKNVLPFEDFIADGSNEEYLLDEPTRRKFVESALDTIQELHTGKQRARQIVAGLFEENADCVYSFRNCKFVKILSP